MLSIVDNKADAYTKPSLKTPLSTLFSCLQMHFLDDFEWKTSLAMIDHNSFFFFFFIESKFSLSASATIP